MRSLLYSSKPNQYAEESEAALVGLLRYGLILWEKLDEGISKK